MSHQRAEALADQVGELTARVAELQQQLAVCDVCCKQRKRDAEDAQDMVRRMLKSLPSWLLKHPEDERDWMKE